jgi:hypothetical protein
MRAVGKAAPMTCKIERLTAEGVAVLRVSGHLQSEHVSIIEKLIAREDTQIQLDLTEITLADRDAVSALAAWELRGIELRNCPPFLREWVANEQAR